MSSMNIEIESYWELLALHKSLMAVKFDENLCLPEAKGSPFTASLAFKVFNELVKFSKEKQANDWLEWQVADDSRIETKLLYKSIKESEWWESAEQEKKEKYVQDFMAPLILNQRIFNEITKNY